jgi:hypothetical protein
MTPTNQSWSKLKPVDELITGLYPSNRWGMIYNKRMGGWHCMSCQEDFHKSLAARSHYCPWESRWRSWSGRRAPIIPKAIKEILVERRPTKKGLVDRFFSFFKG